MADLKEVVTRVIEPLVEGDRQKAEQIADTALSLIMESAASMAENPSKPNDYTMDEWAAAQGYGNALAAEFRRIASKA